MTKVLKKGGKKYQVFSSAKLKNSIMRAAKDAKFFPKKAEALTKEVSEGVVAFVKNKRVVKTTDIRQSVLGRIERRSKAVANAWKRFERKKKK